MKSTDIFPVLDIQKFQTGQTERTGGILFERFQGASSCTNPQAHDFFVLLLFEEAEGSHWIDFVDHPVAAQEVHMLFPGQIHKWDLGSRTKGVKLIVDMRLFETFSPSLLFSFARYNGNSVVSLPPDSFETILREFGSIEEELSANNIFWEIIYERARLIGMLISWHVEKMFVGTGGQNVNPVLYKFLTLIDVYFREHKMVAFYAEQLHIVPNYLNILCKKQFKTSASHIIQERVLLEAKRLVQGSILTIKEIAFSLGFKDLSSFSRFFKFRTGMSPKQYMAK